MGLPLNSVPGFEDWLMGYISTVLNPFLVWPNKVFIFYYYIDRNGRMGGKNVFLIFFFFFFFF